MNAGPHEPPPSIGQRELERERLGQFAVQLAIRFPERVRRRRFAIDYVDDTTIRQRMSVDFMLPRPEWFWSYRPPRAGETIYVPLHLPRKETLTNFSVVDEDGKPLSTLITQENGAYAVAGLFPFARQHAARHHPMPDADLRTAIEEIVMTRQRPRPTSRCAAS